ncbi:MAG: hypothetical protein Q9P14_16560 [candidate division KSB1 bacterium]|nr:hypothetical protein [candidate division KSB1 bacterium]
MTYEVLRKALRRVLALLSALNPFGGKSPACRLSCDYTSSNRHVPQYTSLDFSGLEPGEHTLVVRVRDLVAGLEVQKSIRFKILQ